MSDSLVGYGLLFFLAFVAWPLGIALERLWGGDPLLDHTPALPAAAVGVNGARSVSSPAPHRAPAVMPPLPCRAQSDRLSPEQERRLSDWCGDRSRIEAGGGRAHRHDVEDAIGRLCRCSGEPPLRFRWVDSPHAAVAVAGHRTPEPKTRGRETIESILYREIMAGLAQFRSRVTQSLELQLRDALVGLWSGRRDFPVLAQSNPRVLDRLATVRDDLSQVDESLGLLACCRDVLGLPFNDLLSVYLDLAARAARCHRWWFSDDNVCVVSARPTVTHRDDRGRLHHASGAAVCFRDGFSGYAWHGVGVPAAWITSPLALRPSEALTWPDARQRGAALEIVGWKRVLEDHSYRTIDASSDPAVGELVEAHLPTLGPTRFLKVRCGTGRAFVLAVPADLRTALEANAWTYQLSPDQYNLEART
jgi:hypothetical protein